MSGDAPTSRPTAATARRVATARPVATTLGAATALRVARALGAATARRGATAHRVTIALLAATAVLVAGGCGGSTDVLGAGDDELTVFAAASLTDAFTEIGRTYRSQHPDVTLNFNFGPSSRLATQIVEGAPADVFAPADATDMDRVTAADESVEATPFATNVLQLAVPAGNPGQVSGLADLARPGLLVGLCDETVPCGRFSRALLDGAGVVPEPDTREPDVRALLTKLVSDELDVGLVYRTDVVAAGDAVEGIDVPGARDVVATYPIAVVRPSEPAVGFVALVRSDEGRAVLREHGFLAP